MQIFSVVFGAVIAEALIEYVNMVVTDDDHRLDWRVIMSAVIGVGVSIAFGIDLFEVIGMAAKVPFVGMVLTGVVISRGSNYIHDILKKIMGEKARSLTLNDDENARHEAPEAEG